MLKASVEYSFHQKNTYQPIAFYDPLYATYHLEVGQGSVFFDYLIISTWDEGQPPVCLSFWASPRKMMLVVQLSSMWDPPGK